MIDEYRKQQDLIFQEMDEKAFIQRQAKGVTVEKATKILARYYKSIGKPITDDEARARVVAALEAD